MSVYVIAKKGIQSKDAPLTLSLCLIQEKYSNFKSIKRVTESLFNRSFALNFGFILVV